MPDMEASQNASPPAIAPDSQGDNGGGSSNYEDLRGYALWAISYGIASAIALRTIDALTSSRSTGGHEIAQQKKEKEKTSSGEKETVGAAINRTIGSFFSQFQVENHPPPPQANKDHDRALAKAQAITTNTCKHVIDFYNDCLGGGSGNKCDSYVDIMKKCHQMENHSPAASPQESQASTNNSDDVSAAPPIPTLRPSINLLLMSYHAIEEQEQENPEAEANVVMEVEEDEAKENPEEEKLEINDELPEEEEEDQEPDPEVHEAKEMKTIVHLKLL
ncbi:hypothetical protein LOK49_LG04G01546 [Camellia lanceoleosa]|uniref:Uncharacterized protein n=1 Tax=Camellia lanceoleosa TaxID=1840588 RepID=A0ACC0I219_9ERIC|nr:hypothetical protein LOK49_LG04G01546 [Camellia lanceoleosa]